MDLLETLHQTFGFTQFRKGQQDVIEDIISGCDVLAMLPTGTGKSLCFQLPGYILNGSVVIVSPLISLMEDQVEQLKKSGEKKVVAFNSFLTKQEKERVLDNLHSFRFIYISPESLQLSQVQLVLKSIPISLFVIDEAHCISQWGHEFRTDYLKLRDVRKTIGSPNCLALTATASPQVQEDIIKQLGLREPRLHIHNVDRPNIAIKVEQVSFPSEKMDRVVSYTRSLKGPGIIYTSSRQAAEHLAMNLKLHGILKAATYHGGMNTEDRQLIQKQFLNGQLDVICCTNAFGMGINKDNVRYIIHFHYPSRMESYLQEIGRAGRDGKPSISILLHHPVDGEIPRSLIEREYPDETTISDVVNVLSQNGLNQIDQTIEQLGLSETIEGFLIYQIEQFKLNNSSMLQNDTEHFLILFKNHIKELVQSRKRIKIKRLRTMEEWIISTSCRRQKILNEFEQKISTPVVQCCDNCGIELEKFMKLNDHEKTNNKLDWKKELDCAFQVNKGEEYAGI